MLPKVGYMYHRSYKKVILGASQEKFEELIIMLSCLYSHLLVVKFY